MTYWLEGTIVLALFLTLILVHLLLLHKKHKQAEQEIAKLKDEYKTLEENTKPLWKYQTIEDAAKEAQNDASAFMNQITDNYADGVKRFFKGAVGRGTLVSNNIITRCRNTAIHLQQSTQEHSGGNVTNNCIDNYYTGNLNDLAGEGILIESGNTTVANNNIIHVRQNGITLVGASLCNVIGNTIQDFNVNPETDGYDRYYGISLDINSSFCNVTSNLINLQE